MALKNHLRNDKQFQVELTELFPYMDETELTGDILVNDFDFKKVTVSPEETGLLFIMITHSEINILYSYFQKTERVSEYLTMINQFGKQLVSSKWLLCYLINNDDIFHSIHTRYTGADSRN